ncbi:armadillo-type protein [Crassisporium funariophilum]|nr:armadillo-type protein [Crassisporium funariophilum]
MTADNTRDELNLLLKRLNDSSDYNLFPNEIAHLTSAFSLTREDVDLVRPKAFLVLSAFCQGVRNFKAKGKDSAPATAAIVDAFGPITLQHLGDTNEASLLSGISFLTALFQVDADAASSIFVKEGLVENLMDSVDLSPSDTLCQEVAHLLGQACGHKSCRKIMSPQIVRWLEFKSRAGGDPISRSAAAVALIKLTKGTGMDDPENGPYEARSEQRGELAKIMAEIIISGQTPSTVDAIEGLAYLSLEPSVKETLSKNPAFLKGLFTLIPTPRSISSANSSDRNPVLVYGALVIICNLVSYPPRLSEEQKQVQKLKQMTKAGKAAAETAAEEYSLDDDDHVKARIHSLIDAGVLPIFPAAISYTDSFGVRGSVGKSLLSIIEGKENRGKVLQAGGSKVLQLIVKKALLTLPDSSQEKKPSIGPLDLEPIQALAKLAITSSPLQVFGPNIGAMYDAIRPFSILLQHSSSNLLQRFEAVMALTNLASHSPDMASRIANAEGLLNKAELLLLEEHTLVRRASVELICNLIAGSDEAFERYAGGGPNSATKIQILLALSDVDDLPTRLAASGALATLTAAPTACRALIDLQFDRHRFLPIMALLIGPSASSEQLTKEEDQALQTNPGLVHRGVVCICNVFKSIKDKQILERITREADEAGLLQALAQLMKGQGVVTGEAILQQAAEALNALRN